MQRSKKYKAVKARPGLTEENEREGNFQKRWRRVCASKEKPVQSRRASGKGQRDYRQAGIHDAI